MCGIAGILPLHNGRPVQQDELERMARPIAHRGPDDEGLFLDDAIGLAHRRLSIIDLSPNGHEPMTNEDRSLWLVFNGEIYNFQDIRPTLTERHAFHSNTDAEVILHLYEEQGIEALQAFEGMFAFALWDARQQQLYLVRDRTGEKPLFYTTQHNRVLFASELPSILAALPSTPDIDPAGMHHYFTHVYFTPPAPFTIYKNILSLPPAHYVRVNKAGASGPVRYWLPSYRVKPRRTLDEAVREYRTLLRETVEKQMIADVPLGVMLSGGIDSSSIVATMAQAGAQNIRSYAIGVGQDDPELHRARVIADRFHTQHTETVFTPDDIRDLPMLTEFYGQPLNLLPILYSFELVKKMRQEVTVVLSGSGGDEVFGGYDYYRETRLLERFAALGRMVPGAVRDRLVTRWEAHAAARGGLLPTLPTFATLILASPSRRKSFLFRAAGAAAARQLYSPTVQQQLVHVDTGTLIEQWFAQADADSYLDQVLYTDLMVGNIPSTVVLSDVAGMALALEMRAPFLSHRMIEFAASLPTEYKVRSLRNRRLNKYVMKRAMEGVLPHDLLYGSKMGFGYNIRWSTWLRGVWKDAIERMVLHRALPSTGLFNMDYVRTMVREHTGGTRDHGTLLMALTMFDLWYERHILKKSFDELTNAVSL